MSKRPTDRDRRQVGNEHGFDGTALFEVMRVYGRYDGLPKPKLDKDPGRVEIIENDLRFQTQATLQRRLLDRAVMSGAARKAEIANLLEILELQFHSTGQRILLVGEKKHALLGDREFIDTRGGFRTLLIA